MKINKPRKYYSSDLISSFVLELRSYKIKRKVGLGTIFYGNEQRNYLQWNPTGKLFICKETWDKLTRDYSIDQIRAIISEELDLKIVRCVRYDSPDPRLYSQIGKIFYDVN